MYLIFHLTDMNFFRSHFKLKPVFLSKSYTNVVKCSYSAHTHTADRYNKQFMDGFILNETIWMWIKLKGKTMFSGFACYTIPFSINIVLRHLFIHTRITFWCSHGKYSFEAILLIEKKCSFRGGTESSAPLKRCTYFQKLYFKLRNAFSRVCYCLQLYIN